MHCVFTRAARGFSGLGDIFSEAWRHFGDIFEKSLKIALKYRKTLK